MLIRYSVVLYQNMLSVLLVPPVVKAWLRGLLTSVDKSDRLTIIAPFSSSKLMGHNNFLVSRIYLYR